MSTRKILIQIQTDCVWSANWQDWATIISQRLFGLHVMKCRLYAVVITLNSMSLKHFFHFPYVKLMSMSNVEIRLGYHHLQMYLSCQCHLKVMFNNNWHHHSPEVDPSRKGKVKSERGYDPKERVLQNGNVRQQKKSVAGWCDLI